MTISDLTERIRRVLEEDFRAVAVEGEIGNLTIASSGHAYFTLKDKGAVISCVMWRGARSRVSFTPKEGLQVRCRGDVSVYDKRGQYQLVVKTMEPAGEGALWQKFQKLKEKLEKEGLFARERKRQLPRFPRVIGLVTSPSGAAIRDMLNILTRRAPSVSVIVYPCRVQGEGAGAEITRGVRRLGESGLADVIIAGRGGGSMEDLWEFNDEDLARVIAACPVPVVSGVGHEVDFTICDFVADMRAPTPSAAAELVTLGYTDLREGILDDLRRLERVSTGRLRETRQRLDGLLASHALRRPELLLREYQQRADHAMARLPQLIGQRMERLRSRAERLSGALEGHNPGLILRKGYAIIRDGQEGRILADAARLKKNLRVELEVRDGKRHAVITDDDAADLFG